MSPDAFARWIEAYRRAYELLAAGESYALAIPSAVDVKVAFNALHPEGHVSQREALCWCRRFGLPLADQPGAEELAAAWRDLRRLDDRGP